MSPAKIYQTDQFRHENKTWCRLLDFFKEENAFLKTRLSEVLDRSSDKEFLALAEQFQNKFIIRDEYIDELRHDINEQEDALEKTSGVLPDNILTKKQEKLRNEMEHFEKDFNTLKNGFNKYLSVSSL
ncbi:MAG: hypothetical protein ABIP30_17155 [Ferruginibacter sp.]